MKKEPTKEELVFEKYLQKRTILIADPSPVDRSGVLKLFQNLGAKPDQILFAQSFKDAEEEITKSKPSIVVAEFELGKKCGLDLISKHKEVHPNDMKDCLFLISTNNTSQTAVSRSAEEEVDAYLIKPVIPAVVRKVILKAAVTKIRPPQYQTTINEGKDLFDKGKFDDAEAKFQSALPLDPVPALACYYLGQIKFQKNSFEEAKAFYEKGLAYNKIHYKCMVGLYELLLSQQNFSEAYEVVKKISQYFPANPKRLSEVLRLAIMNRKYEDIERYYAVFCNIDDRDEVLVKYVCAALVVCGKYYLGTRVHARALQLFQKAAAAAVGRPKILKEIILALLDYNLAKDAKTYLQKFSGDARTSDDYFLLQFLIENSEGMTPILLNKGQELIKKGISDERLFSAMISRSVEAGLEPEAKNIFDEAVKNFPEKKTVFEEAMKKPT